MLTATERERRRQIHEAVLRHKLRSEVHAAWRTLREIREIEEAEGGELLTKQDLVLWEAVTCHDSIQETLQRWNATLGEE